MCAVQLLRVSVHERISAAAEDVLLRVEKGEEAAEIPALRALLTERLAAAAEEIVGLFEETVAEYEDRAERSEREICRQRRLLDAVLKPEVKLHRADVQQLLVVKEEVPPEQQDGSCGLDQGDPEPPHIKEEQELQGLEEADITKFPFTPVPLKSEDDEEEPQSSLLHQRQTEDCGGPESVRSPDPDRCAEPDTVDKTEDSSETEVSDGDWDLTREPQSGLNSLNNKVHICNLRCRTGKKPFSCSECGKRFGTKAHLKMHIITHSGGKPFSCSLCRKGFRLKTQLKRHIKIHTREKPFSCSDCDQRFTWFTQLKGHKCDHLQSSQLLQTEENRETEPPASSSTEHMKTEVDGEDCGGPEPARNSGPDRHQEPDTDDKTGDASEPHGSGCWKETRELQSGLNSLNNVVSACETTCNNGEKSISCPECGRQFGRNRSLSRHMRTHTGEKPFSCSVCGKSFADKWSVTKHMRTHTGEKPYSCLVCGNRFTHRVSLNQHLLQHTREQQSGCADELSQQIEVVIFSCSECDKTFGRKDTLNEHMRIHTGERPFCCSECSKTFGRKPNLMAHMRIHTGEKRFSCSVCRQKFTWHHQLRNHQCD